MSNILDIVEKEGMRSDLPAIKIGDTVKVFYKIIEGNRAVSYTHLTLPTIGG